VSDTSAAAAGFVSTTSDRNRIVELALGIVVIVVTVAGALFVLGLFVWGAVKDGQANDAVQAKVRRRRWPR
jgi:hypothetical protein